MNCHHKRFKRTRGSRAEVTRHIFRLVVLLAALMTVVPVSALAQPEQPASNGLTQEERIFIRALDHLRPDIGLNLQNLLQEGQSIPDQAKALDRKISQLETELKALKKIPVEMLPSANEKEKLEKTITETSYSIDLVKGLKAYVENLKAAAGKDRKIYYSPPLQSLLDFTRLRYALEDKVVSDIGIGSFRELREKISDEELESLIKLIRSGEGDRYRGKIDSIRGKLTSGEGTLLPESERILPHISLPGGLRPGAPRESAQPKKAPPAPIPDQKVSKGELPKVRDDNQTRRTDDNTEKMIGPVCKTMGGRWRHGTPDLVKQIVARMRARRQKRIASCRGPYLGLCIKQINVEQTVQGYFESLLIWQCALFTSRSEKLAPAKERILAREEACIIQRSYLEPLQIEANGHGARMKTAPHQELLARLQLASICDDADGKSGIAGANVNAPQKAPGSASSRDIPSEATKTSVSNPDGTRTVTTTDKDGNVLSRETVGDEPTQASSTDVRTGITTTSVRNPDGTRTVTKTDKKGNVLSKETVGDEPTQASSTDVGTGTSATSVQNPDGSRTVTTTDKDGNVLSRETMGR